LRTDLQTEFGRCFGFSTTRDTGTLIDPRSNSYESSSTQKCHVKTESSLFFRIFSCSSPPSLKSHQLLFPGIAIPKRALKCGIYRAQSYPTPRTSKTFSSRLYSSSYRNSLLPQRLSYLPYIRIEIEVFVTR